MQKQVTMIPSTTPLEPDKSSVWKSAENLQKTDSNEIDQEFDVFTKERAEAKNPTPLEPTVVVINMTKNNLGTVTEDEEKHDDIKVNEEEKELNEEVKIKDTNPFKTDVEETRGNVDPLLKIPVGIKNAVNEKPKQLNISKINTEDKAKNLDLIKNSAEKKPNNLEFGELIRKPNINDKKVSEKPFLRDRSASIGTLSLKTPLAHLIGEQNRTMLFQVQ